MKGWAIKFTHGGKDVVFPYARYNNGLLEMKTITKPWKFVKIDKNLYLLVSVCKKLKEIMIDFEPCEINKKGRRKKTRRA